MEQNYSESSVWILFPPGGLQLLVPEKEVFWPGEQQFPVVLEVKAAAGNSG